MVRHARRHARITSINVQVMCRSAPNWISAIFLASFLEALFAQDVLYSGTRSSSRTAFAQAHTACPP
jgi:hypothetical protein